MFELVRRGLIRPDVMSETDGFRFQHALIREAVYEGMPKALRADLHETVAAQLDGTDAAPAVVGYHLEHTFLLRRELGLRDAELAKRAGRLLRLAAEETLSRTDAPATISLLERARALLPDDDRELPALLTGLGVARLNGGDLPGAEAALVEAVDAAVALGQRAAELHARIELQFMRAFAEETPVEESVELAEEAIAELEPLGDELALARAWWLRSTGDLAAGRWRARGEAIERALEHARRAHAGVEMVGTLAGLVGAGAPARADSGRRGDRRNPGSAGRARARLAAARVDQHEPRRAARDAGRLRRGAPPVPGRGGDVRGVRPPLPAGQPVVRGRPDRAARRRHPGGRAAAARLDRGVRRDRRRHLGDHPPCAPRRGRREARARSRRRPNSRSRSPRRRPPTTSSPRSCRAPRSRASAWAKGRRRRRSSWRPRRRRLLADAEFPQLAIAALTAAAEAAAAADDGAEAERLLTEARQIAEAKGATASLAQLDAIRVAG